MDNEGNADNGRQMVDMSELRKNYIINDNKIEMNKNRTMSIAERIVVENELAEQMRIKISDTLADAKLALEGRYNNDRLPHEGRKPNDVYGEKNIKIGTVMEESDFNRYDKSNWGNFAVDDVYGVKDNPEKWEKINEQWETERNDENTFFFKGVTDPKYIKLQEIRNRLFDANSILESVGLYINSLKKYSPAA